MPPRGLPGNANLEQLKKGAKSFQRAVRSGDQGAAVVVNEFHPRLGSAALGSAELAGFTRADAQLVVARQFGFASWPRLKAHLELVERYARSPHAEPTGGPLEDERSIVDEFLRLACLTYGDDDPTRLRRAEALLEQHPWLERASIHTLAATGAADCAHELLASDPSQASLVGGPHRWEPLLYLTYSRAALAPGHSSVAVARLLLGHGADPNAGYLWEGLIPPFTALTGALSGGATAHPEELALARVLLRAGADPNDGQALYNRGWGPDPDEEWLELLFEFGLGTGDGGRWRRLLGDRQDSPGQMLEDLLMAAAGHGLTERVRRLLHRGVSPDGRGSAHPIYEGRSPAQEAALSGHRDVVSLLVEAGARWEPDPVDALVMEAMAGERDTVDVLLTADPGLREQALQRRPDQLVRAAEEGSRAAVSLQQRSPVSDRDGAGTAMRTVTAAFTAVSEGHFDELENLLAVDLDWRGAPDEDGSIPSCHGRAVALERMRIGWAARGEVGVTALVEEGDRVLARVRRTHTDRPEPPDRFVVAEVQDGQITRLCGYLTEEEARDALGE